MTDEPHFCRRGHITTKTGWCRQCGIDRYAAMKSDPVKYAAYIARKTKEERKRYERSQEYRDNKNKTPREKIKARELAKQEARDKAGRINAKAEYMARQASYGVIVKEIPLL